MSQTFELSEFLVDRLGVTDFGARFPAQGRPARQLPRPARAGPGLDERAARGQPACRPAEVLLAKVAGLELVRPTRTDECCGFGGTFAVAEAGLSARMGRDRCADFESAGADLPDRDRHELPHAPRRRQPPPRRAARPAPGRDPGGLVNSTPHFHRDAERFLRDSERVAWHDKAVWHLRVKRDSAADDVPDWEALRSHAAAIKAHVLDHLPELLDPVRREGPGRRLEGALRRRRRRAAHHRARHPAAARRQAGGEEQVDAHRGVRAEPLPRAARAGGGGHRSRRAHRAAAPRAAQPHRHPGHPPAPAGDRRAVPPHHGHARRRGGSHPPGPCRPQAICAGASWRPRRASPGSTSRWPRPARSSSAPTRATPIWARCCRAPTSPAWGPRS